MSATPTIDTVITTTTTTTTTTTNGDDNEGHDGSGAKGHDHGPGTKVDVGLNENDGTAAEVTGETDINKGGTAAAVAATVPNIMHPRVHVFYYPWYASMEYDGRWSHWNHRILPHWNPVTAKGFPTGFNYNPPDDIGANFYPALGPYSSRNETVIAQHMSDLSGYIVVVSWWGIPSRRASADGEGYTTDTVMPLLLSAAETAGCKLAIHLEPYPGRSASTVKEDLKYISKQYGKHPAFYRTPDTHLPVVYVYDSYQTEASEWATLLKVDGSRSIRGTDHDAIMLALLVEQKDWLLVSAGFDGVYTYFAADGFTYGSSRHNWESIATKAKTEDCFLSLSVGPGYIDTRIRPWNDANTHSRKNGAYYEDAWRAATSTQPDFISVTSYNEWHEGTQIEAAVPKKIGTSVNPTFESGYTYSDYQPHEPDFYLTTTRNHAMQFDPPNKT
ncbi:Glycoprotein endo-alpha-1,2-mannosidase [Pelomyxa schiedti]|nr:Glycoprotein endo-alpha-1,2-mannosidase [Pelomyxa schiedti]